MPHRKWLQSLADMLSAYPEDQAPSQQLIADVQLVLDEAIILVVAHAGQLPDFVMEVGRIEAIYRRLGEIRLAELAAQPLSQQDKVALISLIPRVCRDFDALSRRKADVGNLAPLITNTADLPDLWRASQLAHLLQRSAHHCAACRAPGQGRWQPQACADAMGPHPVVLQGWQALLLHHQCPG